MAKKLHYFQLNGLAEAVRYLLHYGGQEFEDVRYAPSDWPIKSVKDRLPFGQLPIYEEEGKTLNQSFVIARYVAAKLQLLPSDPWEQAILDAVTLNIYDFWGQVLVFYREKDAAKKAAHKKILLDETVDYFFSRFEKELKENNGFFGGKLSWADFVLVGILESSNLYLSIEIEDKYPTVFALVQKIRALPGVKEYIASRKPYISPV